MKFVVVIRHAKSSWDDPAVSDFDRPLNERGSREAPLMAKALHKRPIAIDAFISSPAKRARKTAVYFAKQYGHDIDKIVLDNSLYLAEPEVFYNLIAAIPNHLSGIALFAHNPGITNFVNSLTDQVRIDDMPTCSVFAVSSNAPTWADFRLSSKNFLFFDAPRNHR